MSEGTDYKSYINTYLRIVRATVIYFSFGLLSFFCQKAFYASYGSVSTEGYLNYLSGSLLLILIQLLALSSIIRVFAQQDYSYRRALVSAIQSEGSFINKIKIIVKRKEFLVELCVVLFWQILLPLKFGFSSIVTMFGNSANKLWTLPMIFALFFLIDVAVHISVIYKCNISEMQERTVGYLAMELLGTMLIYSAGSFAVPVVISMIGTFFKIALQVPVYFIFAAAIIVAINFVFKYLRAIVKRISFINKLSSVCNTYGYIIYDRRRMYLSLFFDKEGYNFTLSRDNVKYFCKMLSSVSKRSRMLFYNEGVGRRQHFIKYMRTELTYFNSYFSYDFEGDGVKLLVINPTPNAIFAVAGKERYPIDVGYELGEYKIYNATGLLGALERNCINKGWKE